MFRENKSLHNKVVVQETQPGPGIKCVVRGNYLSMPKQIIGIRALNAKYKL